MFSKRYFRPRFAYCKYCADSATASDTLAHINDDVNTKINRIVCFYVACLFERDS